MKGRLFEKLLLRSQLLEIEEQEFREFDEKYRIEFARDFIEERLFLAPRPDTAEKKDEKIRVPSRVLKKLHRSLAKVTHPDVSKEDSAFIDVQRAYEDGDASKLLALAEKMSVEVKLTEREMRDMSGQLDEKVNKLAGLKKQVRWIWGTSEKTEALRVQIRRSMGISDEAWEKHKASRSS